MHELIPLLAKIRAEELDRIARRHAERPPVPHGLRRRPVWRRLP